LSKTIRKAGPSYFGPQQALQLEFIEPIQPAAVSDFQSIRLQQLLAEKLFDQLKG
jgi:hypothetical protein